MNIEEQLLASYQEYLENWIDYLVPADVQRFDRHGSGPYICHTFDSFLRYLYLKAKGKERCDVSEFERSHYCPNTLPINNND